MSTVLDMQDTSQTREFFLAKRFYDKQKFPYSFSRSGDFTIFESNLLERFGSLFLALQQGQVSNPNKEDKHFLKVVQGKQDAQTLEEKVWMKYLRIKARCQIWLVDQEKVQNTVFESDNDDSYDSDDDSGFDNDLSDIDQVDLD
ncbi:MAG: DUF413 domain-containing protein [Kangiellaceae bacterium]|jgi:uncharacterized protein